MKTWHGEINCNICGKECETYLYDGQTNFGPWAVMCYECFQKYGVGLGLGKGQEYLKNPETNEFEKVKK